MASEPQRMEQSELEYIFNSLKPKQAISVWFNSAVRSADGWTELQVGRKSKSKKYNLEKISLTNPKNPKGSKYYLYNRQGRISFAMGDMGTSLIAIKKSNSKNAESFDAEEERWALGLDHRQGTRGIHTVGCSGNKEKGQNEPIRNWKEDSDTFTSKQIAQLLYDNLEESESLNEGRTGNTLKELIKAQGGLIKLHNCCKKVNTDNLLSTTFIVDMDAESFSADEFGPTEGYNELMERMERQIIADNPSCPQCKGPTKEHTRYKDGNIKNGLESYFICYNCIDYDTGEMPFEIKAAESFSADHPKFDPQKADRNKDGKISSWERTVGNEVAKSMAAEDVTWMIDSSKYEGHTPGPWIPHTQDHHGSIMIKERDDYWPNIGQMKKTADKLLAADAPKILYGYKKQMDVLTTLDEKIRNGESHADLMKALEQGLGLPETWKEMGAESFSADTISVKGEAFYPSNGLPFKGAGYTLYVLGECCVRAHQNSRNYHFCPTCGLSQQLARKMINEDIIFLNDKLMGYSAESFSADDQTRHYKNLGIGAALVAGLAYWIKR